MFLPAAMCKKEMQRNQKETEMLKTLLICSALVTPALTTPALAQMQHTDGMQHTGGMAGMNMDDMQGNPGMDMSGMVDGTADADMMARLQAMMGKFAMQQMMGQMMMDQMGGMDHAAKMGGAQAQPQGVGGSPLSEPGQSAFAAIAEVVAVLKADPNTDWSKVNIDALRNHLRDMDIVTIDSTVVSTEVEGGLRFDVTGAGEVTNAIRRMATAHAGMMDGVDGWAYTTEDIAGGAAMTVIVPEGDLAKLKGLGFYGIMASGMHHQPHHWMMATGGHPHG